MCQESPLYLVKVEPNANNNKYYRMIPLGGSFTVEYGRIGNSNFQTRSYLMSQWDKKLNEKINKGYIDQTRLVAETVTKVKNKEYVDITNPVIASICERLQAMANQAIKDNYTISSSKVTKIMVDEAQQLIYNLIKVNNTVELFNESLVELFKTIPRKMKTVKEHLASDTKDFSEIIQREQDLLDVMKGQVIQQSVTKPEEENAPTNNQTILEVMGLEFEEITKEEEELIKENLGSNSNRFHKGWKVRNLKTQKKYDTYVTENKIKNTKLLWHGSRNENWWSIINTGLVLRPTNAVITGKMFGFGIYFAPLAQKSLGYTSLQGSYWAGGSSNSAFMSLYEVAYGKPYDVYSFENRFHSFNYDELQKACKGANSLHAHAGSMLRNDEIIVYKEEQLTIKYLVELK